MAVEPQHVDDLLAQLNRKRILEERDGDLVADDDDVLNVVGADDAVERVDDFLDVMKMNVLDMALIACLGPPAHRGPPCLHTLDVFALLYRSQTEREDPRVVRIEHHRCIARILIHQAHERIDVRDCTDEEPVVLDRRIELNGLEEVASACRGKECQRRSPIGSPRSPNSH